MKAVSHLIISTTAGLLLARAGLGGGGAIAGAALGGTLPDLDLPPNVPSPLERWIVRGARRAGARLAGEILAALIRLLRVVLYVLGASHRGWLHSPLIPALAIPSGWLIGGMAGDFLFGLGVGILTHLLADSLTPSGLRWFRWRVRGPIRTGGPLETAAVLAFLAVAAALFACMR